MIIVIGHQWTFEYWATHLCPFVLDDEMDIEIEWHDRWLDWLVGSPSLEGSNDQEYYFPFSAEAVFRLTVLEIPFETRMDD